MTSSILNFLQFDVAHNSALRITIFKKHSTNHEITPLFHSHKRTPNTPIKHPTRPNSLFLHTNKAGKHTSQYLVDKNKTLY
jgi:hypothetical protein